MNVNVNDIIKALECKVRNVTDPLFRPACNLCVYKYDFLGCNTLELYKDIIDFINRQKAEIERLESMNQSKLDMIHDLRAEIEVMNKAYKIITVDLKSANLEIEMMEALSEQLGNDVDVKLKYIYELEEKLKTAKAEAIKEFAERLKEDFMEYKCGATLGYIEHLVKEMTGERE